MINITLTKESTFMYDAEEMSIVIVDWAEDSCIEALKKNNMSLMKGIVGEIKFTTEDQVSMFRDMLNFMLEKKLKENG
jgi:hypothetical protein